MPWGESDPFGLVYYPRMVAWFNDTEHELFRHIGYPIEKMIEKDKTTFVMGEIQFRFIGPAAYGDRVMTKISLEKLGQKTLTECTKPKTPVQENLFVKARPPGFTHKFSRMEV